MFVNYLIHTLITIGYYIILVASLNVALGYSGMINLGHVAFFAIGAYASAILTMLGVPFILAFFLAAGIAAIFGYILTRLTERITGDYFALATLGFSFVVGNILLNWKSLTKGALGISGIPKPSIFGFTIGTSVGYLVFVFIVVVACIWLLHRIVNSRYGKILEAVRDDAIGLAALGKNTFRLKYQAMMVSAAMAGIAGVLFAHYITYIHPSNFYLTDLILLLSIVIVGGLASIRGSVVATFLMVFLVESMRFIALPAHIVGPTRLMIYSLVLIVILLFRPRGLFGRVDLE